MEKFIKSIQNNTFSNKHKDLVLDFALVSWVIYLLFPLLTIGFISDEAYNSLILGKNIVEGVSLWDRLYSEINGWLTGAGRFWPFVWFYKYGLYTLQPTALFVKLLALILIILNVVYFSRIVRFITNDRNLSYICAFIVPLFFQFRLWHDPIMAFTFMIPLIGFFLFATILLMINYLEDNNIRTISTFGFLYLLSLWTYELTYIFIAFYILIIIYSPAKKGWWKPLLLIVALTAIHLFITIFFRDSNLDTYPGAKLNFDYKVVLSALLVQVTSALPLSWKLANAPSHESWGKISYSALFIFTVFSIFFTVQFNKIKKSLFSSIISLKLFVFGLVFLVAPAIPIALTGHQHELINMGFGYGYIVVFLQYFGSVILFLYLIYYLKNRAFFKEKKERGYLIIFLIILCIGYFTRMENSFVAHEVNKAYKYPRDLLSQSIDKGILDDVPSNALLLRSERYASDHLWFYSMKMGKKMNICDISSQNQFPKCLESNTKEDNLYGVAYSMSKDFLDGSVYLTKVKSINVIDGIPVSIKFEDYKIFNKKDNNIETVSTNKTYDLLKIKDTRIEDMRGFEVDQVSYGFKDFHSSEGGSKGYLRWSSGDSTIIIDNSNSEDLKKILSLTLIRPNSKFQHASISITQTTPGSKGFLEMSRYFVLGKKDVEIILNLKPGVNYLNFKSDSHHIDNGDLRNIVFGIGNYKLNDFIDY